VQVSIHAAVPQGGHFSCILLLLIERAKGLEAEKRKIARKKEEILLTAVDKKERETWSTLERV
jgi:hypothetical protein